MMLASGSSDATAPRQEQSADLLKKVLVVGPPHRLENAPNAYAFTRRRLLDIDWAGIVHDIGLTENDVTDARRQLLRSLFEQNWGITPQSTDADKLKLIQDNTAEPTADVPAYVHDASSVVNTTLLNKVEQFFYLFKERPSAYRTPIVAINALPIEKGSLLSLNLSNGGKRWFQLLIKDGDAAIPVLRAKLTADLPSWEDAWNHLAQLEQVYYNIPQKPSVADETKKATFLQATTSFPSLEVVRADAATIMEQVRIVQSEDELANALTTRAASLLSGQLQQADAAALASLVAEYRNLKSYKPKVERLARQLVDAAAAIGYKLFTRKQPVTYYNAKGKAVTEELDAWTLYKAGEKTVTWYTYKWASIFEKPKRVEHRKTFTYYEQVAVDYDPWTEIASVYEADGYATYLFRETADGLRTADGVDIETVLERCRDDELFRVKCVVGVPFYEQSIIGDNFLVGYIFFVRPLPDTLPSQFPRIFLSEELTYRFAWTGVSLGELAATMPLSPGEERSVSLVTSERREASRTKIVSSLLDVTRVDKTDFETEFEREVRREKETSSSGGGSIGGSYGGLSGSANFSQSTTTKDMSRQLNRSVQRAAQEVNRRAKEETSVTVSEKTESSASSTTTYKVRNINEGRTLNISLYRLVNSFDSQLQLNDWNFVAETAGELIMGTDLRTTTTFARTELADLLDHLLAPGTLPFLVPDDRRRDFKIKVCRQISELACREYQSKERFEKKPESSLKRLREAANGPKGGVLAAASGVSVRSIPLWLDEVDTSKFTEGFLRRLFNQVFSTENCDFDKLINVLFGKTSFAYDSGGLYADSVVGSNPATEEYSERMRDIEKRRKSAEAGLEEARARYLNSRALKGLLGLGDIIDPQKIYVTDKVGLYQEDGVRLHLRIVPSMLASQEWILVIGTPDGGRFAQSEFSNGMLEFDLPQRFGKGGVDVPARDDAWFADHISVASLDLSLSAKYRPAP